MMQLRGDSSGQRLERGSFKEFRLTSWAIDHTTSILVLAALVVVMGINSYVTVPKESFPEIVIPNIVVNTVAPGVAPRDVETLVTRELEEELNGISDVKEITSVSIEGYSNITVEFSVGVDMDEALQQVREKVDLAKPDLPDAAEDPTIFEINFAEFPIVQVNVSGDYDLVRLREVAEELQDRLEVLPSVLEVTLAGGLEREVKVDVDLPKLKFYGLSFDQIVAAIQRENITVPGGTIDVGRFKYLTRVPGEYATPEPLADIVVATRNGIPIYVRDVASVDFGFKERDSYARLNGDPVVSLAISKRPGQNIIATVDQIRATVAEMRPEMPTGTMVTLTADQSEEIRSMVSNLENNIISGLLLVVGVLLFFLGARTAWFVGLAIPLSMLMSFIVLRTMGLTMNMVVLFSLILSLGMLVDNAIVIVENIYRFREYGYDRHTAAKYATGEVALPVIASTATTLAAFLPMTFWPGMVGEFMRYLPLTLMTTLSSSLFVGLVIVPTLCALFLDTEGTASRRMSPTARGTMLGGLGVVVVIGLANHWLATSLLLLTVVVLVGLYRVAVHPIGHWFMNVAMPTILVRYERILRWSLSHRWSIVSGTVVAFVFAIVAFGWLNAGVEFFPEDIPPNTIYVQVEAPIGTRVEETDRIMAGLEQQIRGATASEDFESVVGTVGSKITQDMGGERNRGTHLATIAVNFVDFEERKQDALQTLETLRSTVGVRVAGATVSVERPQEGVPTGAPINIEILGDDPAELKRLGDAIVDALERSPVFAKLDGLESNMSEGQPELVIEVDRERAALHGLSTQVIGSTIRSAINGVEASNYRDGEDEYDITVRLAPEYRRDLDALRDLTIVSLTGNQIPISSVADWHVGEAFADIYRRNLDRVVTVSSDVRAGFNANAVLTEVQRELDGFARSLPPSYRLRYTGQQEEQDESRAFLMSAFIGALFLIAFILVSLFDSVLKPFIIMTSVFMSTIGVLLGLIVFRMPFGIVMTGVGVISLAGVVVNNAIVLIDYVSILRNRDRHSMFDSLVLAGTTRFRPVILTAITTILGLVPLAIGLNFDFVGLYDRLQPELYWGGDQAAWWGPMAIAVIAGLAFATFLTLILVPVLHSLLDDLEFFARRVFASVDREEEETAATEARDRVPTEPEGAPVPATG